MILTDKISDFIPKAFTQLRKEQTELMSEFDRPGYQSEKSDYLLLIIGECFDFISLLQTDGYGGLTEREVSDLIDFFSKQLDLNKVIAANYSNYSMPIAADVIVTPPGNYATAADLAAEIQARIAADNALSARIAVLEANGGGGASFPEGFWNNLDSTYAVVFDDDPRLHSHANKTSVLDQLTEGDLTNIKALVAHFQSVGDPGGLHVSAADRARWDDDEVGGVGSTSVVKEQYFTGDGTATSFTITNGTPQQINFVAVNTALQPPGSYSFIGATINFGSPVPDTWKVHVSYFEGLALGEGGGAGVYDLASPSTVAVGGMPAGTNMSGRTWQSLIEEMAVDYLPPAFSSFDISDIGTLAEVGTVIGGNHDFIWNTTNSFNVQANTVQIRDVTSNTVIASGLANDGAQTVDVGVIANTSPITRQWRVEAQNTLLASFNSGNRNLSSIYPYFWGKVSSSGAAPGVNRPTANQALINSGTKVVQASNGTVTINFNSTSDDYIWFAIPASMASKLAWYVSALNNGPIGGSVSPGGNLFPDPSLVTINSPTALWSGIQYKIYVSNYQSAINVNMELRNS
ncbi:MAG: hypothetical protein QM762_12700 [Chryseolinea sp.]